MNYFLFTAATLGIGAESGYGAAAAGIMCCVSQERAFRYGIGFRVSEFVSKRQTYKTAEIESIQKDQIETVEAGRVWSSLQNVMVQAEYEFSNVLSAGFNLDLLGLTLGRSSKLKSAHGNSSDAKPTRANYFLVDNRDHGSLNSEFYVSYDLDSQGVLLGGLSHFFHELQVDSDRSRFRVKANHIFFGLRQLYE